MARFFRTADGGLIAVKIEKCRRAQGERIREEAARAIRLTGGDVVEIGGRLRIPTAKYRRAVELHHTQKKEPGRFATELLPHVFTPLELAKGRVHGGKIGNSKENFEQLDVEKLGSFYTHLEELFPTQFCRETAFIGSQMKRSHASLGKGTCAILHSINKKCNRYKIVSREDVEDELTAVFGVSLSDLPLCEGVTIPTMQAGVREIVSFRMSADSSISFTVL